MIPTAIEMESTDKSFEYIFLNFCVLFPTTFFFNVFRDNNILV